MICDAPGRDLRLRQPVRSAAVGVVGAARRSLSRRHGRRVRTSFTAPRTGSTAPSPTSSSRSRRWSACRCSTRFCASIARAPCRDHKKRRAIIIGGSMSGLFTAAFLRQIGWDADVYERSGVELVGRGAGITTHPELLEALEKSGAGTRRSRHRGAQAHRHRPAGPRHRRAAAAANPDLMGPPATAAARDHRSGALPSRLGVRAGRAERQRRARAFQRRPRRGGRHSGRRRRHPLDRARPGRAGAAADLRRLLHLARRAERGRSGAARR